MPRILAIDYGQKRTGLAVTDELQIIGSGLTTIPSETAIAFLKDYFSKERVLKVLIGEPKQMNNEPSESTAVITLFMQHVKCILHVVIFCVSKLGLFNIFYDL